ncbi:hypothetical protein [Celeribacter halophilus]|uniref:hypothetical protein n=1 Tax=Celeribacter halophilus TaxID=576117 RepID=UPI0009449231
MKTKIAAAILAATLSMPAHAGIEIQATTETEFGHGGGCRKNSPPGQCCHMQTSTGTVHCH